MRNDQAIKFKNLKRGQFLHSNFLYTDYTLDYTLASLERIGAKKLEFYGAEPHLCFYDLTYGDSWIVTALVSWRSIQNVAPIPTIWLPRILSPAFVPSDTLKM